MRTISLLFVTLFCTEILFASDSICVEHGYLQFDRDKNFTIESLQKMLKRNPNDLECKLKLVNLYLKKGEVSRGFELLMDVYKKDPDFVRSKTIYKIVHIARYITHLEKEAKKSNDIKYWNLLGLNYYKMGVFKEAIRCYKKSLSIKPLQVEPRLNLAISLSRIGRKYMAIDELQKVIKIDKDNFYAYYYAGKILKYQIGDKQRAEEFLKIAKKLCKKEKNDFPKGVYAMYIKDLNSEIKTK